MVEDEAQQSIIFDRMCARLTGLLDRRTRRRTPPLTGPLTSYGRYDHLMREEQGFVGELDRFLQANELGKQRKSRELYSSWRSEIYEPIQTQVSLFVPGPVPQ